MGNSPHIAIIGTGALACVFGARLSQVACVTLVGSWAAQIEALQNDGLDLVEMSGTERRFSLNAAHFPTELASIKKADYALVLVKSYQTKAAAERIKALIKPNGVVLSLQNGLGNQEKLLHTLPFHMVSSGITMQGANVVRPGWVAHTGNGVSVIDDKPFLSDIKHLLLDAGLPIQSYGEYGLAKIEAVLWHKLLINAAINPLTALLNQPNGYLADNEIARELCVQTTREALCVAQKEIGFAVDQSSEAMGVGVALQTAANRSSMLQDVTNGRPTEIDAICGEIVRRGEKLNIKTPLNSLWLRLIQGYEASGKRPFFTAEALGESHKVL